MRSSKEGSKESPLTDILREAGKRRSALSRKEEAFRLLDGAGDGISGLYIDSFKNISIAKLHSGSEAARDIDKASLAKALLAVNSASVVYLWVQSGNGAQESAKAELIAGEEAKEIIVSEGKLKFLVRPGATPSGGLFLDMRNVRQEISKLSAGKRVLNTFCFTGSLGIAALSAGAAEVVQVDSSKSALTWAAANLELNRELCSDGAMRVIPEDCGAFMRRETRRMEQGRGKLYDLIIIDPPVFGTAGKKNFSQERDLPQLVELAFLLLAPKGEMYLTSNRLGVTPGELEALVREKGAAVARGVRGIVPLEAPKEDFTAPLAESPAMRGVRASIE